MKKITVDFNIDDSAKLQKLIDSTGNTPAQYIFPENGNILIKSLLRFWNNTEIVGNDTTFELMENAPTSPFGEQIPLLAPKYSTGATGLVFHDLIFEGNRAKQSKVPKKNNKNWGLGYHNFIGLGSLSSVSYSNASNCEFYNIIFKNNLGDWIRPEGATNLKVHDITGELGGHDYINFSGVNGGEVYNVKVDMAVGSAIRMRSCKNIKIHDNTLDNRMGLTYGPGIQIQSRQKNWISDNLEIYNNTIFDTYGPGIQITADVPDNKSISVHHNLFVGCGAMPASVDRPTVGGVVFNGYSDVQIKYNTFDKCLGYGIAAGDYDVTSSYGGTVLIEGNIITNTQKSYKQGVYSGTGIANLSKSEYTFTVKNNCQYGNKTANHYGVSFTAGISADPQYVDVSNRDYHLKEGSPCILGTGELGAYNGVDYHPPDVSKWPAAIISLKTEDELRAYIESLYSAGYLSGDSEIRYMNVSDDFTINT